MHLSKPLKILHWNAQGITNLSTAKQLELLLHQHNIDIVMLNETFCKAHHKLYLNGYTIYRNDRSDAPRGGVAIAVKHSNEEKVNSIANTFEKSHTLTTNMKHSIDTKVKQFNKQMSNDKQPNLDVLHPKGNQSHY